MLLLIALLLGANNAYRKAGDLSTTPPTLERPIILASNPIQGKPEIDINKIMANEPPAAKTGGGDSSAYGGVSETDILGDSAGKKKARNPTDREIHLLEELINNGEKIVKMLPEKKKHLAELKATHTKEGDKDNEGGEGHKKDNTSDKEGDKQEGGDKGKPQQELKAVQESIDKLQSQLAELQKRKTELTKKTEGSEGKPEGADKAKDKDKDKDKDKKEDAARFRSILKATLDDRDEFGQSEEAFQQAQRFNQAKELELLKEKEKEKTLEQEKERDAERALAGYGGESDELRASDAVHQHVAEALNKEHRLESQLESNTEEDEIDDLVDEEMGNNPNDDYETDAEEDAESEGSDKERDFSTED
jgi:hypothetical protein